MLSVRLPVHSRLLVVKFGGSERLSSDFQLRGGLVPYIVQGSTTVAKESK